MVEETRSGIISAARPSRPKRSFISSNNQGDPKIKLVHLSKNDVMNEIYSYTKIYVVIFLCILLWYGTLVHQFFPTFSAEQSAIHCGSAMTVVMLSYFSLPLWYTTSPRDDKERKFSFILVWFSGSLLFNVIWQIPLWAIDCIHQVPDTWDNLWWRIYWASYSTSDALYANVTKQMKVYEWLYLYGNLFGVLGFCYMLSRSDNTKKALTCFCVCGVLQNYNASLYLVVCYYIDELQPITDNYLSWLVYFGLNGGWAALSMIAAKFSFDLLHAS